MAVRRDPPGRDVVVAGQARRPAAAAELRPLRDKVNPDTYGGSYLIGLRAIAVKAHGDSGPVAISNALRHAARGVREGLIEDIARRVHPEPREPGLDGAVRRDTQVSPASADQGQ